MAGDAERRLEKIMGKLSQPAPPAQKQPLISSDGTGRKKADSGLRVPTSSVESAGLSRQCRPWDQGDLMRRMATFKAMTWFGKPKAISPVSCARRGWINVEMDVISCEACGARLLFSTPSSWTLEQVEKVAAVFSLKLDNGHKSLCPWINNACDEKLARFPPIPPPALVDSYRKHSAEILRLTALPVVSPLAINYMKSPQLEHFLHQSSPVRVTLNNDVWIINIPKSNDLVDALDGSTADMYYQALKIIGLCGWEPCLLPYVVDGAEEPLKSSGGLQAGQRNTTVVHTSEFSEVEGVSSNQHLPHEYQYDPASVVLDCKLCGARVGLWSFKMVERPMEHYNLIVDPNGEKVSATGFNDLVNSHESSKAEIFRINHQNVGPTSREKSVGLNLTIAGGLPPTKQNFRPVVSFPIVSRHLKAEFSSTFNSQNCLSPEVSRDDLENSRVRSQMNVSSQQVKDVSVAVEDARSLKRKRSGNESVSEINDTNDPAHPEKTLQGSAVEILGSEKIGPIGAEDIMGSTTSAKGAEGSSFEMETQSPRNEAAQSNDKTSNDDVINGTSIASEVNGDISNSHRITSKDDSLNTTGTLEPHDTLLDTPTPSSTNSILPTSVGVENGRGDGRVECKAMQNSIANDQDANKLENMLSTINRNGKADHRLGLHHKTNEFDPIRQHRTFCPWIAHDDGQSLPGWKLTLSALVQQEKVPSPDKQQRDTPSGLINEEDDPIVSIRKLFMSPPTKRLKGAR